MVEEARESVGRGELSEAFVRGFQAKVELFFLAEQALQAVHHRVEVLVELDQFLVHLALQRFVAYLRADLALEPRGGAADERRELLQDLGNNRFV